MNRKQFLATMVKGGTAVTVPSHAALCSAQKLSHPNPASAAQNKKPQVFVAQRAETEFSARVSFPPEAVFPLLCPIREYDWLEGWKCELVYSKSGFAENNCIFKTAHLGRPMTWSVSRYEPPRHIEFVAVVPDGFVMRLNIVLEPLENGTNLRWTRIFTGLSEAGNQWVVTRKPDRDTKLTDMIEYYLKTGSRLAAFEDRVK